MLRRATQKSSQQPGRTGEQLYSLSPVEAPEQAAPGASQPIWIRLPRAGEYCKFTGLSRSGLNALILGKNPPVKSASLKQRYAVRGTRLVNLQSLLDYIEALASSQNQNAETSHPHA